MAAAPLMALAPMAEAAMLPAAAGAAAAAAPAAAGIGAAGAGLGATGAGLGAAGTGGLYGAMLPGIGPGMQAAMLQAQTAPFGLSGLAATGNAAASAAGGPASQALWGAASQLGGPMGKTIGTGLQGVQKGMQVAQAMNRLQGGGQPMPAAAPAMRPSAMPQGQGVPTPVQIAMAKRLRSRAQRGI